MNSTGIRRLSLALILGICGLALLPAAGSAATPRTVTVGPTGPAATGNCFPFGIGNTWTPFAAFIYKNIPAFELKVGDTLAFDTNAVNEADVQIDIALGAASSNGSDVHGQPFKTVISNTQTPANPRGDTVVGDYEMQFKAQAPFSFPGGGLIIRFANPSPTYATDATCTGNLVGATGADPSGLFVDRGFGDVDGSDPWISSDTTDIGAFRLTLQPTSDSFILGSLTRNTDKGTAFLVVNVPGPGTVSLTGKRVTTQRTGGEATASVNVTSSGTVLLPIKPKGKAKKKLKKTGKAKVTVNVTFAPAGDPPGDPKTQSTSVKLVKKLG
jgi:hypothetical protein